MTNQHGGPMTMAAPPPNAVKNGREHEGPSLQKQAGADVPSATTDAAPPSDPG